MYFFLSFNEPLKVIYANNWYKIAQHFDQNCSINTKKKKLLDHNIFLRMFSLYNSKWKTWNKKKTFKYKFFHWYFDTCGSFVSALQHGNRSGRKVGRSVITLQNEEAKAPRKQYISDLLQLRIRWFKTVGAKITHQGVISMRKIKRK